MASKKSGKAAGLAALAALAYMANEKSKGKDDGTYEALESRRLPPKKEDVAVESGDFFSRRLKTNPETGEAYSMDNLSPMSAPSPTSASSGRAPEVKATPKSTPTSIGGGRSGGRGGAEVGQEMPDRTKPAIAAAIGSGGGRGPAAGEEAAYAAAKRREAMFTPPSKKNIDEGMDAAAQMLPAGASLTAIRNMAAKLANRGKSYTTPEAVKELGYEAKRIGSEPLKLGMKRGGVVKKMASGGLATSASKRGDGIASKGKTRCKMY